MEISLSSHVHTQQIMSDGQLDVEFNQDYPQQQIYDEPTRKIAKRNTKMIFGSTRSKGFASKLKLTRQIKFQSQSAKIIPKFSELQRHLQALKEVVPEMFTDEFVDKFYAKVYQKINKLNSKNERVQVLKRQPAPKKPKRPNYVVAQPHHKTSQFKESRLNYQQSKTQLQTKSMQDELQGQKKEEKLMKLEEASGYSLEMEKENNLFENAKVMASVFCEKGFNTEAIEEELRVRGLKSEKVLINIPKIMSHIVHNAYNLLYKFLVEQCEKDYPPLDGKFGHQFLISFLINCSTNLSPQSCEYFYKIIKGQLGLANQQIIAEHAQQLYSQIQRKITAMGRRQQPIKFRQSTSGLNQRAQQLAGPTADSKKINSRMLNAIERYPQPRQIDQVNKLNKVWNNRYEWQLLKAYREGRTFSQITDNFKMMFPRDRDAFSAIAIRSQLYKILRKSIKKFYYFISNCGTANLPEYKKLSPFEARSIIYNNDGIEIRLLLVEIYISEQYDERLITDTILAMKRYVDLLAAVQNMANHLEMAGENLQKFMKKKAYPYNSKLQ